MEAQIKESKRIVEYELTLKLTHRELLALRSLLGHIGGNSAGPRGLSDQLIDTFSKFVPAPDGSLIKNGSVYFVDYWPEKYKE